MFEINLIRIGRTEEYKLICPYNEVLVNNIKTLPSEQRKYNPVAKEFTLKAIGLYTLIGFYKGSKDILFKFEDDKQRTQFINVINKHKKRIADKAEAKKNLEENNKRILEIKAQLPELVKNFDYKPYLRNIVPMQHQLEGAYFVNELDSSILAMEMGVGKTLTAILASLMNDAIKQVLVICPANLKINWFKEISNYTNVTPYIIKMKKGKLVNYKRNDKKTINEAKFIITNYEYFASSKFDFNTKINDIGLNPDIIIYDEAHKLSGKNNTTFNIKTAFRDRVKRNILLTGTPVRNRLAGLFPLLKIVKGEEFSNESKYFTEYCGLKYSQFGWVPDEQNPPKLKELNQKLQTFMYRVKKDVMGSLPDLYINKIVLEMSDEESKEYSLIESGMSKVDWERFRLTKTTNDDSDNPIVILSRLRMFTSKIKLKYAKELIENLNDLDEKVVLFDVFKKPLKELKNQLGDQTETYDGDLSGEQKQHLVDEFQDDNSNLKNLLISMTAGNSGITLTKSRHVILVSQDYLPSNNDQSLSRLHRYTQLRDVFATILVVGETIDETIDRMLLEKNKTINAVVDGTDTLDERELSVFNDVINELKNKYSK